MNLLSFVMGVTMCVCMWVGKVWGVKLTEEGAGGTNELRLGGEGLERDNILSFFSDMQFWNS